MITNTARRRFDVVEVTNEMPVNRIGGVGTVVESLASGFAEIGTRALWFLVAHPYRAFELDEILDRFPAVAVGTHDDIARFDAAIAHLHSYNVDATLVDVLRGRPTVFTIHSLLAEEEVANDVDLGESVRWQEQLIGSSDRIALTSEAERSHYAERGYDALNPRASVVYNGIRPPTRFRTPRARRTLGYCGRLVPRKHPEYVQMVLCEEDFADCRTLIAGKAFSTYARDLVQRLGLEERVRYLGWCDGPRLDAFWDAIDVLALPATYEPFGLAALEAAARGVPVVCTRVDGLVEVLGDHAFYAEGCEYEHFLAAMRAWARADEGRLARMAHGARARFLELFTDVAMARRYLEVFEAASRGDGGAALNGCWSARPAARRIHRTGRLDG